MSQIAVAEQQHDILSALRGLGGSATVGDVVAATGMATGAVDTGLRELLERHRGHLDVTDSGELLYRFDPDLIRRGTEPFLSRAKRTLWSGFQAAFKVWIVVTLVVYLVVFVALILAAIFAGDRDGDGVGGGRGRRRGGGGHGLPLGDFWLWYWIWGPRWRLGRPYYGHRWERTLAKDDKVPFYKKVFAFVFGPDRPQPTQRQLDRGTLRLIRARNGVLTTPELVEHTALPLPEAETEMARVMASYDGQPVVTPDGEVAYVFPGLMTSAHGTVAPREPNPAWLRLEYPRELTGNTAGANALVVGINGFNLLAALTAPWFIFPRLGIGGPLAWFGLVIVPVLFSLCFFAIPGLRMLGVRRDNRRRERRNVRRVVLGLVYERAMEGRSVSLPEALEHARSRLTDQPVPDGWVEDALHDLASEFGADVRSDGEGPIRFTFEEVRDAFAASDALRRTMDLRDRDTGPVVYSTADTSAEASRRDLERFDRELATGGGEPAAGGRQLRGYVPATDRVAYEADYELVAFDEELAAGGA